MSRALKPGQVGKLWEGRNGNQHRVRVMVRTRCNQKVYIQVDSHHSGIARESASEHAEHWAAARHINAAGYKVDAQGYLRVYA